MGITVKGAWENGECPAYSQGKLSCPRFPLKYLNAEPDTGGFSQRSRVVTEIDMTILRQKIEHELDALDSQSMAAVYEHLRQMNRLRRAPRKRRMAAADIEQVLELTSSSKSSWAEAVSVEREERL